MDDYRLQRMPTARPKFLLPAFLFLLTVVTTTIAGAHFDGADPLVNPASFVRGFQFSVPLLLILATHELGHYFTSLRHGVDTTLPYFIPGPPIFMMIGTFGAVIKIKSPINTRKALVDIGASGPLAGFVIAVLVVFIGLKLSWVIPVPEGAHNIQLGSSLVFSFLEFLVFGPLPKGYDVFLHPVAFAGWIGMLVTSLNLLPIGQLDGGHILYALVGPAHKMISRLAVAGLILFGIFAWQGWLVWGILVTIIGLSHPPTLDAAVPLDRRRRWVCVLALIVFILTFTPSPFYIS